MFDLEMPPALQPFTYLAGSAWPGSPTTDPPASETRMLWLEGYLQAAADGLEALIPDLARVRAATQAVLVGETAAAAERQFALLFDGPYAVAKLVEALRALGGLAANLSELIRYMKLQIISTLGITAASISWALANAEWTLGASLEVIPAVEEAATLTINELVAEVAGRIVQVLAATLTKTTVSRLVAETLVSAALGGGQEAGVEAVRALLGGRGGIDVGKVLEAAWSMAAGGGVAGLVGHVVGGMLGPAKGLLEQILKGGVTGASAGVAAFEAGAVAGGSQPTWETLLLGGVIGLHGAVPHGGGHATAGHDSTEAGAVAGRRPAPASVEGLPDGSGAARDGAVKTSKVGSPAHGGPPPGGVAADPDAAKGAPDSVVSAQRVSPGRGVGAAGVGGRDSDVASRVVTPDPGGSDRGRDSGTSSQGERRGAGADKAGAEQPGAAVAHTAGTPVGGDAKGAGGEGGADGQVDPGGVAGSDGVEVGGEGAQVPGADVQPGTAGGADRLAGPEGSRGPHDLVDDDLGVRRYADELVRRGSIDQRELTKRIELACQASSAEDPDSRVIDARAQEAGARTRLWDSVAEVDRLETELAAYREGRVPVDGPLGAVHRELVDAEAGLVFQRVAVESARTERDRLLGEPAAGDPESQVAHQQRLADAHQRVAAAQAAHDAGEAAAVAAKAVIEEQAAKLEDAVGSAQARMEADRQVFDSAVAAHDEALRHAVDELYEPLRAEAQETIAAEVAQAEQVWAETGDRMRELGEGVTAGHTTWEGAGQALEQAVDEFEAAVGGEWDARIADAQQGVAAELGGLREIRRAYEKESSGSEPRQQRLKKLRADFAEGRKRLRPEMIRREALLRAAPGDHGAELEAARAERAELEAPGPGESVVGSPLRWLDRARFDFEVSQRVKELKAEPVAQESAARVEARQAEFKAATEDYAGARQEFESAGRELVAQRLEVLHTAGSADVAAYEAGLADRTALEDAARKREAAAAAAEEIAAAYDDVVWRAPQDAVAVRRSDAQVWDRMVNGTTIERITTMPEWVRRATGMDPRETQWQGWMLAAADMKTGEGKTLVASMRIVLDLLEYGRVHAWTSSDHLVSEMIDAVNALTRSPIGELPVDTYRMGDEGALPKLREGRSQFFADTKQNYKFRALRAMRSMLDHIAEAAVPTEVGVPPEEIAARRAQFIAPLREWINARPRIDDIKNLLDAAAAQYGLAERFEPFPPGRHIVDEIDMLFDGEEAVLSPGGNEDAPEEEVALLRQVLDRVNAAEKLGLGAEHFGRPENTMGMWDATLTDEAIGFLNRVPGGPVSVDDPNAKLYTDAALAKWGRRRNSDWIEARGGDPEGTGQVGLIASDTNDKLQTNRENLTSTRLQGVGKFLDLLAGVPVKADLPEESLYLSDDQLIGSSLLLDTGGWSGTADLVAGEFHDRYGILISKVEPYYESKLREEAPAHIYESEEAKLKGMAGRIVDDLQVDLNVQDGRVVGVTQSGRPKWVVSYDNRNIRGDDVRVVDGQEPIKLTGWRDKQDHEKGLVDWVDQFTDERARAMIAARREAGESLHIAEGVELKLQYTVRDARWWDEHGNGVEAEQLAKQQTAAWGDPGSLHFGHKGDTRGVDPTPTPESIKLGGTAVMIDGGPEYGERAVWQGRGRAARGGHGDNRKEGGTPGSYEEFLSRENLRTRVANDGVVRQVIQFTDAVKARDAAETPAQRDQAEREVAAAETVLREQTAPRVQRLAEEHLLTRTRGRAYLTHPPPVRHTTSAVPPESTTAAAGVDGGSVEQMATPLAGAAEQLAFAQQHFAQRGVTPQITLSDTSILTATQLADVFSRDTVASAVPLQSAPPGGGWHDADMADLVARLLDDTDPTDLAFLLTTSPAGSGEHQSVWTLTTSEGGQLLLHEVAAAPTDTDPDAAPEYDHLCANAADVRACIRLQPGTTLHAIIADRDGAIIAQPPADIAVLTTARSAPARGAAVGTHARANTAVRGAFGRRGRETAAIRDEVASLGSSPKDLVAQGGAQHEARLQSLAARVDGVATEHAGPLAPRGADVLSLPMYSPGAADPVELNQRQAEQAHNAVHVLGDRGPDWRSEKYALYRVMQGMPPMDAAEVARFQAAERLGVDQPHLLDPAELTAILARTTSAQRADVDQNVAGRDDGADRGWGAGGFVEGVLGGLRVDPAVLAVANQALAQRVPSVRVDELVRPLGDRVAVVARAQANAVWWKGLRDDQRWALIAAHPRQIGQLDGIPARETDGVPGRHEANSELWRRYVAVRDELVARRDNGIALNRRQVDYIEQVNGIEAALREAEQWAREAGVGGPYLWKPIDPFAFGGNGQAVVWFGDKPDGEREDIYRAESVSWYVPGMGTTIRKLPLIMRRALNQLESVRREAPGLPAASFAWIGYQAPGMGDRRVLGLGMAHGGGKNLHNDIVNFNASRDAWVGDGSHFNGNHVFGHGYGSAVLGSAGRKGRLRTEIRTATLVGSAGSGEVEHASEFGIGEDNVYIASSSRDPVTGLGGRRPGQMGRFPVPRLGPDPAMKFWGGRRVISEFPAEVDRFGQGSLFTHSLYWDYVDPVAPHADHLVRSESLANFGCIAAGKRVYTEARRTVVRTGWRRERTHDPAADRAELRLVDDPDTAHPTGERHWSNPRWHTGFNPRWHTGPPGRTRLEAEIAAIRDQIKSLRSSSKGRVAQDDTRLQSLAARVARVEAEYRGILRARSPDRNPELAVLGVDVLALRRGVESLSTPREDEASIYDDLAFRLFRTDDPDLRVFLEVIRQLTRVRGATGPEDPNYVEIHGVWELRHALAQARRPGQRAILIHTLGRILRAVHDAVDHDPALPLKRIEFTQNPAVRRAAAFPEIDGTFKVAIDVGTVLDPQEFAKWYAQALAEGDVERGTGDVWTDVMLHEIIGHGSQMAWSGWGGPVDLRAAEHLDAAFEALTAAGEIPPDRGVWESQLSKHSRDTADASKLNEPEALADSAVSVLGNRSDWRSVQYALYRALRGMPLLDAAEVERLLAAERLGVAEPHLLDPAELTAAMARATGAQRADVDERGSVAGREHADGERGPDSPDDGDKGSPRSPDDVKPDTQDTLEDSDLVGDVRDALEGLRVDGIDADIATELVKLLLIDGATLDQAAQELGLSKETAADILSKAMPRLRPALRHRLRIAYQNCAFAVARALSALYPGRKFRIGAVPTRKGVPALEAFIAANSASEFAASFDEVRARLLEKMPDDTYKMADGASAIVAFTWAKREGGHVILAVKRGDEVEFVDAKHGQRSLRRPPYPDNDPDYEVGIIAVGYLGEHGDPLRARTGTSRQQAAADAGHDQSHRDDPAPAPQQVDTRYAVPLSEVIGSLDPQQVARLVEYFRYWYHDHRPPRHGIVPARYSNFVFATFAQVPDMLRTSGWSSSAFVASPWAGGGVTLAFNDGGVIRCRDPYTGERSEWPPLWGRDAASHAVVGYVDFLGNPVRPLVDGEPGALAVADTVDDVQARRDGGDPVLGRQEYRAQDRTTRRVDTRYAEDLGELVDSLDPERIRQFAEDLSGVCGPYRIVMTGMVRDGAVDLSGVIVHGDELIGIIRRIYFRDSKRKLVAYHHLLRVFDKRFRFKGFSKALYSQLEALYERCGVDRTELWTEDNGFRAWVRRGGFTWNRDRPSAFLRSLFDIKELAKQLKDRVKDEAAEVLLDGIIERLKPEHPNVPEPIELLNLETDDEPRLGEKLVAGAVTWLVKSYPDAAAKQIGYAQGLRDDPADAVDIDDPDEGIDSSMPPFQSGPRGPPRPTHKSMPQRFLLDFGHAQASAVRVLEEAELRAALAALGLHAPRPTVVVVGGAGGLDADALERLRVLFTDAIVPVMQERQAAGLSGGTRYGVMRLLGEAHAALGSTFPLVGVVRAGEVQLPGQPLPPNDVWELEPGNTHFVVLPPGEPGVQLPGITYIATVLAGGGPSVTVVINGGEITYQEVEQSIKANRPVVVVAGTGGAADDIAHALAGEESASDRAHRIAASGLVSWVSVDDPAALAKRLAAALALRKNCGVAVCEETSEYYERDFLLRVEATEKGVPLRAVYEAHDCGARSTTLAKVVGRLARMREGWTAIVGVRWAGGGSREGAHVFALRRKNGQVVMVLEDGEVPWPPVWWSDDLVARRDDGTSVVVAGYVGPNDRRLWRFGGDPTRVAVADEIEFVKGHPDDPDFKRRRAAYRRRKPENRDATSEFAEDLRLVVDHGSDVARVKRLAEDLCGRYGATLVVKLRPVEHRNVSDGEILLDGDILDGDQVVGSIGLYYRVSEGKLVPGHAAVVMDESRYDDFKELAEALASVLESYHERSGVDPDRVKLRITLNGLVGAFGDTIDRPTVLTGGYVDDADDVRPQRDDGSNDPVTQPDPASGATTDPVRLLGLEDHPLLNLKDDPHGTLEWDQANELHQLGERRLRELNERLIGEGVSAEERAKTLFRLRWWLESWTRALMTDRAVADELARAGSDGAFEGLVEKLQFWGLVGHEVYGTIIDAATRIHFGGLKAAVSDADIDDMYDEAELRIGVLTQQLINERRSNEEIARTIYDMQRTLRIGTIDALMSNRPFVGELTEYGSYPTFEQLVERHQERGRGTEAVYQAIIESSRRSGASVSASLGIDPGNPPKLLLMPDPDAELEEYLDEAPETRWVNSDFAARLGAVDVSDLARVDELALALSGRYGPYRLVLDLEGVEDGGVVLGGPIRRNFGGEIGRVELFLGHDAEGKRVVHLRRVEFDRDVFGAQAFFRVLAFQLDRYGKHIDAECRGLGEPESYTDFGIAGLGRDPDLVGNTASKQQLSDEVARARQWVATGESGFFVLVELSNRSGLHEHRQNPADVYRDVAEILLMEFEVQGATVVLMHLGGAPMAAVVVGGVDVSSMDTVITEIHYRIGEYTRREGLADIANPSDPDQPGVHLRLEYTNLGTDSDVARPAEMQMSARDTDPFLLLGLQDHRRDTFSVKAANELHQRGEWRLRELNERLIGEGVSAEERARILFGLRRWLGSWIRDLLNDRLVAHRLARAGSDETFEGLVGTLQDWGLVGDEVYGTIIDAATRIHSGGLEPTVSDADIDDMYDQAELRMGVLTQQLIDKDRSSEEIARTIYDMQRTLRIGTIDVLMSNRPFVEELTEYGNYPTFEQLVERHQERGLDTEAAYQAIIASSRRGSAVRRADPAALNRFHRPDEFFAAERQSLSDLELERVFNENGGVFDAVFGRPGSGNEAVRVVGDREFRVDLPRPTVRVLGAAPGWALLAQMLASFGKPDGVVYISAVENFLPYVPGYGGEGTATDLQIDAARRLQQMAVERAIALRCNVILVQTSTDQRGVDETLTQFTGADYTAVPFTFGSWLAELRRKRGWNQKQLAEASGRSRPVISRIENGRERPSRALAECLLVELEVHKGLREEGLAYLYDTTPDHHDTFGSWLTRDAEEFHRQGAVSTSTAGSADSGLEARVSAALADLRDTDIRIATELVMRCLSDGIDRDQAAEELGLSEETAAKIISEAIPLVRTTMYRALANSGSRSNCAFRVAKRLSERYKRYGCVFRVLAELTRRGVSARALFEAANCAAQPAESYDEVGATLADMPVGSSAILVSEWADGGPGEGGHAYLAEKDADGIWLFDPTTGRQSPWPPWWGQDAVLRIAVGYLNDKGRPRRPFDGISDRLAAADGIFVRGPSAGRPDDGDEVSTHHTDAEHPEVLPAGAAPEPEQAHDTEAEQVLAQAIDSTIAAVELAAAEPIDIPPYGRFNAELEDLEPSVVLRTFPEEPTLLQAEITIAPAASLEHASTLDDVLLRSDPVQAPLDDTQVEQAASFEAKAQASPEGPDSGLKSRRGVRRPEPDDPDRPVHNPTDSTTPDTGPNQWEKFTALDGRVKISGHGAYDPADGVTVVPPGTEVRMFAPHGAQISGDLGQAIESGVNISHVWSKTFQPGDQIFNYTIHPIADWEIVGHPYRVDAPTLVGDILGPGMGPVDIATCVYAPTSLFSSLTYDVKGIYLDDEMYTKYTKPKPPYPGADPVGDDDAGAE
jgi:transcriptional regulator with XRE-family HTH domain